MDRVKRGKREEKRRRRRARQKKKRNGREKRRRKKKKDQKGKELQQVTSALVRRLEWYWDTAGYTGA